MAGKRHDFFRGLQQARYAARPYRNPHIRHEHRSFSIPWKPLILVFLAVVVIGLPLWALFSGTLNLREVRVRGNIQVPFADISSRVTSYMDHRPFLLVPQANRYLFDADALADDIRSAFAFESVDVTIEGQRVMITVEERASLFTWSTAGRLYFGDQHGQLMRELTTLERSLLLEQPDPTLLSFTDANNVEVSSTSQVLSEDEYDHARDLQLQLSAAGYPVQSFTVDRLMGAWMSAACDGFNVIFDPLGDVSAQVTNVALVLRERVPDPRTLDYIDVRFGDHVYYR